MRVLSWNLYHGRDFPPEPGLFTLRSRLLGVTERGETHVQVNRPLLDEFAGVLDRLEWDVALLQEAPPRWFAPLATRTRSSGVRVLTSRNWFPAMQARLADLNPDLIASSEGGSNQILVRHPGRVLEHRRLRLALRPERRWMQWTRLDLPRFGRVCVANLHASAGLPERANREVVAAGQAATQFSGDDPLILGGDFNLRPALQPEPFATLRERFGLGEPTAPRAIDHVLARGLQVVERPRRLAPEEREVDDPSGLRIRLSDHAPVVAEFVR
jgi:endonuclease/exonuclease/phosphatase family metal-dependent hydrolase